jgi:ABC-type sugar transport system substrate-binding protein
MAKDAYRVQITVRLKPEDKDYFSTATQRVGMDPSVAARQILELVVERMRRGGDFIDALHELKVRWNVPGQSEVERRIAAAQKALGEFKSREEQEAILETIEQFEKTRAARGA